MSPSFTSRLNLPSMSVMVPVRVPSMRMPTPTRGSPALSLTRPVMTFPLPETASSGASEAGAFLYDRTICRPLMSYEIPVPAKRRSST